MSFSHQNNSKRRGATALLALTFCVAGAHLALAQSRDPIRTVVPILIDTTTGNITVGSTTYQGRNPGMNMVALKRQPGTNPGAPDLVNQPMVVTDSNSANSFLQNVLQNGPDALMIVNATWNYSFSLDSIASNLEQFGSSNPIDSGSPAFVFIGNGGLKTGNALQRGYSARNISGYLATDTNNNYKFIQTDYIRYSIASDGTITIGSKAYTVADSYKPLCSGNGPDNSFHLVVTDRESPDVLVANNTYCTAQSDNEFVRLIGDINTLTSNVNDQMRLVFLGSKGNPIPGNVNYNSGPNNNGDGRLQPLARQVAQLGGFYETIVYLTPQDKFFLVGAPPPAAGTKGARNRAREFSSVYPDGAKITGLSGVLARGSGNLYSPLNADPIGKANLGLYDILAQAAVSFPYPSTPDENSVYDALSTAICGAGCNVRNQYANTNIDVNNLLNTLSNIGTYKATCLNTGNTSAACNVWNQLYAELNSLSPIRGLEQNLTNFWTASGTNSILSLLSTAAAVKASIPAPDSAPAPSLFEPVFHFLMSVAALVPEVGPIFGLADTTFNFATALTADNSGNPAISLGTTVGKVESDAIRQFQNQGAVIGTQFDLIYQDWGKIQALGKTLGQAQVGSPWYWDGVKTTSMMLAGMTPAITQGFYQSIMAGAYAIGSYLPQCPGDVAWNRCPDSFPAVPQFNQPITYISHNTRSQFQSSSGLVSPFSTLNCCYYSPYTYLTDSTNPFVVAQRMDTSTLLGDGRWLGIGLQTDQPDGGDPGLYSRPDSGLLSNLFKPRSQGGLGVYRPAFFEAWPLPRIQCAPSGQNGDYWGCHWGDAAPAPEAHPAPLTSAVVRLGRFQKTGTARTVAVVVTNNGTMPTKVAEISRITLRTLAGSGQATLVGPQLPIRVGSLMPGHSATVRLQLNIPPSVTRLMITQEGTVHSGQKQPARFVSAEAVFPAVGRP